MEGKQGGKVTLKDFFTAHPKCAIGFSGGVDSSYLLAEGLKLHADIMAYYVRTPFQPDFEYRDALRMAQALSAPFTVLEVDVLCDARVASNPPDRCYYCKKNIFESIEKAALSDGYPLLIDGTNASDDASDRPGMKALNELAVMSPLRLCGLTKAMIREKSRGMGLFTWSKPAYACLATRIAPGCPVTKDLLHAVESSEQYLRELGFTDLRVRTDGTNAKIQVRDGQLIYAAYRRHEIVNKLSVYFRSVVLDLEGRS